MLIPLRDDNTLRRIPFQFVTVGIIGLCFAVFLWEIAGSDPARSQRLVEGLGLIPAKLSGNGDLAAELQFAPSWATLVTYSLLHAGWWHLLGNMLFLWVFGDNVEDDLGHGRFALFYVAAAVAAGLAHMLADPLSTVPLIGASGAVSGVLGAYLLLHPRARVWVLVLGKFPLRVPAYLALVAWLFFQIGMAATVAPGGDGTAWLAHVAGFVVGVPLAWVLRIGAPMPSRGTA